MFTDGSRGDSGATGYSVVWRKREAWAGIKTHMGYNQEAYDAECAALARALETAARRNTTLERVTIFSGAQTANRRMASDEPGPGQQYELQARKHIAALWKARPDIIIEIRWCSAHKGIAGNEKADEWAKISAEEPDTRGVEWIAASRYIQTACDLHSVPVFAVPQTRRIVVSQVPSTAGCCAVYVQYVDSLEAAMLRPVKTSMIRNLQK